MIKTDTGLYDLRHQAKLTEYIDFKKLVKSDDIICIQFENDQNRYRLIPQKKYFEISPRSHWDLTFWWDLSEISLQNWDLTLYVWDLTEISLEKWDLTFCSWDLTEISLSVPEIYLRSHKPKKDRWDLTVKYKTMWDLINPEVKPEDKTQMRDLILTCKWNLTENSELQEIVKE